MQPQVDLVIKHALCGLEPGSVYEYCLHRGRPGKFLAGIFRTASVDGDRRAVRFAFGGDLAGQNVCRDRTRGFPSFRHIVQSRPHFLIGLGDMIYADNACESMGRFGNRQFPSRAIRVA